jgi:hypothetical protein
MDRYIIQSLSKTKRVRLQTDENVDALYKYLGKNYFIYLYLDKFFYLSTKLVLRNYKMILKIMFFNENINFTCLINSNNIIKWKNGLFSSK